MSVSRLLIICPDRPGIVATVSSFLYERGANILDAAQHTTDAEAGTFFMRLEYALDIPDPGSDVEAAFAP
jgi:formyltetrahydrofolate deformylase